MVIDKVLVISTSIIKNLKDQVLLVQRSNKSSYPNFWQLVEGKLEEKESPEEALRREVKEEIGVSVVQLEMKTVLFNEIEAKGLKYLCFRVIYKATISSDKIRISDEHINFGWFGKEEALKLSLLPGTKKILEKV